MTQLNEIHSVQDLAEKYVEHHKVSEEDAQKLRAFAIVADTQFRIIPK